MWKDCCPEEQSAEPHRRNPLPQLFPLQLPLLRQDSDDQERPLSPRSHHPQAATAPTPGFPKSSWHARRPHLPHPTYATFSYACAALAQTVKRNQALRVFVDTCTIFQKYR